MASLICLTIIILMHYELVKSHIERNMHFQPCDLMYLVVNSILFFLGTGFDEEAALIGAGREFALMKTASGKVSVKIS